MMRGPFTSKLPKRRPGDRARRPTFNTPDGRLSIRRKLALAEDNAARLAHTFANSRRQLGPEELARLTFHLGVEIEGEGSNAELRAILLPMCQSLLKGLGLANTLPRGFPRQAQARIEERWRMPAGTLSAVRRM